MIYSRLVTPLVLLTGVIVGCDTGEAVDDDGRSATNTQRLISTFDTIITPASGVVGRVVSMTAGPDGRIWLSDALNHRVLVIDAEGNELGEVGRQGAGPGEFQRPDGLAVSDRSVWVYDSGNRRVQRFDTDGSFVESSNVGVVSFIPSSVNDRGDLAVPSMGFEGGLVQKVHWGQETVSSIGTARAPMPATISQRRIREQAAAGVIPQEFRNNALPVIGQDGHLWLVTQAEGNLERFSPDGERLWTRQLPRQDVQAAFDRFFEIGTDLDLPVTIPWVARAGSELEGDLWLLTDAPQTGSALVVLDGETGDLLERYYLDVGAPPDAFAVDTELGLLFISSREEAGILRASLPRTE